MTKNIYKLILVVIASVSISFSQQDNFLQNAEDYMKKYKEMTPPPQSTENPEDSWKEFYLQSNPSVNKTLGFHVNMMPSYYQSTNYANFVLNQPGDVWGNVNGGQFPYRYILDFGDGVIDSGNVTDPKFIGKNHTYSTAGQKVAKLIVRDANGVSDSDQTVVRVFPISSKQIRINQAIEKGLVYLYKQQNANGYWYGSSGAYAFGTTGMVLLSFEENGHRPMNDPNQDIYSEYVRLGLNWLMQQSAPVNVYTHSSYDPEQYSKDISKPQYGYGLTGKGVFPMVANDHSSYANGCAVLSIVAAHSSVTSAKSDTITVGNYATFFNTTKGYYPTYYDYIVDACEGFSHTQNTDGGWRYEAVSGSGANGHSDAIEESGANDASANQWPILVLDAAEDSWGIDSPEFVKSRGLSAMKLLQNANGGVGYTSNSSWLNAAKTGSGLVGFAWVDSSENFTNAKNAIKWISDRWTNWGYGSGDNAGWFGNLYAMYGVKKGFTLINNGIGIQNISYTYSGNIVTRNWYDDMAAYLLGDWSIAGGTPQGASSSYDINYAFGQRQDGSWYSGEWPINWQDMVTPVSILVLTQGVIVAPPVAVISSIDPKPALFPFNVSGGQSYHQNPQKSIVEYLWDWNSSDGTDWESPDATGMNPLHPGYEFPGTYTITLRIGDDSEPQLFSIVSLNVRIDSINSNINHPPISVPIPADRLPYYAGEFGEPILFDARDSYDPDLGDYIASYSWDLNGDGVFGDATTDTVSKIFYSEFDGEIGLKVIDSYGATATSAAYVRIVVAKRDILVESFNITPRVSFRDSIINIKAVFKNDSLSDKSQSALVRFYDNDPLISGEKIGNDYNVSLAVGGRDSVEFDYTIPNNFSEGAHYIYVFLDPNYQVNEWDEVNNRQNVRIDIGKPNSVVIRNIKDSDGKLVTNTDRNPKQWFLSLYKDSISANTLISSIDSSELIVSGLENGNYIAVRSDSVGWKNILKTLDGEVLSNTAQNSVSFTVSNGVARVVEFISFKVNAILIKTFADIDQNFQTSDDRISSLRTISLYRNSISLSNLVATVESDSVLFVDELGDGIYIAVLGIEGGWEVLGNIVYENGNAVATQDESNSIAVVLLRGEYKEVDFVSNYVGPSTIKVRVFSDTDGKIRTDYDRTNITPEFSILVYKDFVAPENLVEVQVTDTQVVYVGTFPGTLVVVQNFVDGYIPLGYVYANENVKTTLGKATIEFNLGDNLYVDFVNYNGDTLYYRTVIPDSLTFARKTVKLKSTTTKPSTGNLRDTVMNGFGKNGMIVGIRQTDKNLIKLFGWIKVDKGGSAKLFPQKNESYHFDSIRVVNKKTKVFVKELKNPTWKTYSNHILGEMFALTFNIKASEMATFPSGFQNLVYDDGDESNPFNGLTTSQIKSRIDSLLTYKGKTGYEIFSDYDIAFADSVVSKINRAFYDSIDENDFVSFVSSPKEFLQVVGVRSLLAVEYMTRGISKVFTEDFSRENLIPKIVELSQNYPNPFNPKTIIEFELNEDAFVTVSIYNSIGQKVKDVLLNEEVSMGYNEIEFDGSNLSSGMYFYKMIVKSIETGKIFEQTQKMMLVK